MAVFFTSDTHFGDPRVLRLDRRPFADMAEHDEALVAAWNAVVAPGDTVFHLGDFCAARPEARAGDLLARLVGEKHLIVGNNDGPATVAAGGWSSVAPYREMTLDGRFLVLCHYPFRTWRDSGRGAINLHGHSHGRLKPLTRQFDVGVDAFAFKPVTLEEILASRRRPKAVSD